MRTSHEVTISCRPAPPGLAPPDLPCTGKAGGFLALDWNDTGAVGPLARASYRLHAELAEALGAEAIGYRTVRTLQVPCRAVPLLCYGSVADF